LKFRNIISFIVFALTTAFSVHGQDRLDPACAESVERYGVSGLDGSTFYWYFDHRYGTIVEGDLTDTVTIQWGYQTGDVELEALEVTNAGCKNNPSQAVIEIMAPDVNLGDPFPEICLGDTLILDVGDNFQPDYEILWNNGSNDQLYMTSTSGEIWVRVIDGFGCMRYDTVSLLVNPLPVVDLGIKDTILCDQGTPLTLEPGDFATYDWTTSSGESSHASYFDAYPSVDRADTIFLSITDYNMCPGADTVIILPCDITVLFRNMPNTITPNNDGKNDVWVIPYIEFFDDAVLEIFDRWGRLVFRTTNVADNPWDGTSKGRLLPMDSYYYVLNLNVFNTPPLVGTVNLIK
jgi:gliding motility-associated-like protein